MPRRILVLFGTRPEAIKLLPVVRALRAHEALEVLTCASGQHGALLDEALAEARHEPDHRLPVTHAETLDGRYASLLVAIGSALDQSRPDRLVVQGDTLTAFAGAQAAFHRGIAVAHVEAGLRTGSLRDPFPEEGYRRLIAPLADLHFAPGPLERDALIAEGVAQARIHVTGNTVVDALILPARKRAPEHPSVVATIHRRENVPHLVDLAAALAEIAARRPIRLVLPLHPNPDVREPLFAALAESKVELLAPLPHLAFLTLLRSAQLVLTDSGGVQEEAASLGVPALVLRETTERMQGVIAGSARLVGTGRARIVAAALELLDDEGARQAMVGPLHLYGDGRASERIARVIASEGAGTSERGKDRVAHSGAA